MRLRLLDGHRTIRRGPLRLYMISGREKYIETAQTLIRFLRRRQVLNGCRKYAV